MHSQTSWCGFQIREELIPDALEALQAVELEASQLEKVNASLLRGFSMAVLTTGYILTQPTFTCTCSYGDK